jgi:alkylated DNA repair dioxygenase AlkB
VPVGPVSHQRASLIVSHAFLRELDLALFSPGAGLAPIPFEDGELYFLDRMPLPHSNEEILVRLIAETEWRAQSITVGGRQQVQPRLSAWHGDPAAHYRYSGTNFIPLPWTALLTELKLAVETATGRAFNSVLLNYYRDQRDSMGFHSDDEAELGPAPAIASLSFGAARTFILKHKFNRACKPLKLALGDGMLLLMAGSTQTNWRHGINKESRDCGPRINLTFRQILSL